MKKFRIPESREQVALFPRRIDDYVPAEDTVRYVDAVVNEFDISAIENCYSFNGRPAYSPRTLVKILLYGKLRGIRSSRELARACRENVRFMYLAQHECPDFRTIILFRKRFLKQLGDLLTETVKIGLEEGIITLEHVAIDGTKVRANASGKSFRSPEKLQELLNAVSKSLREDVDNDDKEDEEHGDDDGDPKLPSSLQGKESLKNRIQEALKRHEEQKTLQKHYSTTDPDANFMKGPEGKKPSYNLQAAVDAGSMMVVAGDASTEGADHGQLKGVLQEIERETGRNPKTVTADKGYRATEGLVELERRRIKGFVALQESDKSKYSLEHFMYDQEEDEYICPEGRNVVLVQEKENSDIYQCEDCGGCARQNKCLKQHGRRRGLKVSHDIATIQRMQYRLQTPEAKTKLKERSRTIELIFGWAKARKLFRQLTFRGRQFVRHEWRFELTALNFERLLNFRMSAAARG